MVLLGLVVDVFGFALVGFSSFFFLLLMCVIKKTYWKEEYVVDLISVREM